MHGQSPAGKQDRRTAMFGLRVRDFLPERGTFVTLPPDTRCQDMVHQMVRQRAAFAAVVDVEGRPIGVLSERDVVRRIAFKAPPDTPIDSVMTTPVSTIDRNDFLSQAIAMMRRLGVRELAAVDRRGSLVGILELEQALAGASGPLLRQIDRLSQEGSIEGLRSAKEAQVDLAEELFAENMPAADIQNVLTRINNDMYRRIGEAVLRQMQAEGWGDLPVKAATIVMGSGGRGENYLFPDQDNGFVITDYPDHEHATIDRFFLELAERMCRDLNSIGIAYCNGYCMAINPLWRKTLSQWIEQIRAWGRRSNFVAIRLADIFFDFQPVWGHRDLAFELRHTVTELVRHNHFFLKQMHRDKEEHNVALGFFGGFITERERGAYRGHVNLKYMGTIPLVGAIRLLALREGVEETETLARIKTLHDVGVLSIGEEENLSSAFEVITGIMLRRQLRDFRAGKRVSYYVDPGELSRPERGKLQDSLRSVDAIRKRVHAEFTGEFF